MAATKTRSTQAANGSSAPSAVAKAKDTGDSIATAARKANGPMLTAGATAAGLAGGLVLGSRARSKSRGVTALLAPQRRVLGVPVGRKNGVVRTAKALGEVARELSSASNRVSAATDEVRQVREELEKTTRRSPIEVLLDGLTHRRGAHKRES
jgi:hypothetical protein